MTRAEAIELVLSLLADDDIVVCADGAISREAYKALDRPRSFYMVGSMGQVLSIALGLAMTRFERVVALDGDGNLLMGLGGMAMVGALKPSNLYHVVLDNGCYETTGGQPAVSQKVDLSALAVGAGYAWSRKCFSGVYAQMAVEQWFDASGPAFLDMLITRPEETRAARVPMTPEQIRDRFRAALRED